MENCAVIDMKNWLWLTKKYETEWNKAGKHIQMEIHILPRGLTKIKLAPKSKSSLKHKSYTEFMYLVKVVAMKKIYGVHLDHESHVKYMESCPKESYIAHAPDGRIFLVGLEENAPPGVVGTVTSARGPPGTVTSSRGPGGASRRRPPPGFTRAGSFDTGNYASSNPGSAWGTSRSRIQRSATYDSSRTPDRYGTTSDRTTQPARSASYKAGSSAFNTLGSGTSGFGTSGFEASRWTPGPDPELSLPPVTDTDFTELVSPNQISVLRLAWSYIRPSTMGGIQGFLGQRGLQLHVTNQEDSVELEIQPTRRTVTKNPANAVLEVKAMIDARLQHCAGVLLKMEDGFEESVQEILQGVSHVMVERSGNEISLFGDEETVEEVKLKLEVLINQDEDEAESPSTPTSSMTSSNPPKPPGRSVSSSGRAVTSQKHVQPYGDLTIQYMTETLPGEEDSGGTIVLIYSFLPGIQNNNHPNPGEPYEGKTFKAYLPKSPDGERARDLLQAAFQRKLTFTIGWSASEQKNDVIIWRDIPHKTEWQGKQNGYPDPGYLKRVIQILEKKEVEDLIVRTKDTHL